MSEKVQGFCSNHAKNLAILASNIAEPLNFRRWGEMTSIWMYEEAKKQVK